MQRAFVLRPHRGGDPSLHDWIQVLFGPVSFASTSAKSSGSWQPARRATQGAACEFCRWSTMNCEG